jgi:outer membrane usher protein
LLFLFVAVETAWSQDVEALHEQVFGKRKMAAKQSIPVALFIDKISQGEIRLTIASNRSELEIESAPLLRQFQTELKPEVFQRLEASTNALGNFRISDLKRETITVEFDELKLELRVSVPPELRRPTTIKFTSRLPQGAERAIPQSPFSAYLNVRSGVDYVERSATGRDEGLQPMHVGFDGAINYRGWVLEGSGTLDEAAPSLFRRGDVRLVRDDTEHMIRYSAGDVVYPTAGFQGFQPMLGFSLARNFALQPYRVTEPRGQTSFILKSPSKVEVLVNGQSVQTLQLPAGPHSLRDFMFSNGGNEVVLRITDEVGRTEIVRLSFFFDTRLLAQGEQEFSYNIGLPSRPGEPGLSYDRSKPYVSLLHRFGVSDSVTSGINFQGDVDHQLLGAETVWATPLGTFQPDIGLSYARRTGMDYGTRLGYRYADPNSTAGRSYSAAVQYRGASFASFSTLDRPAAIAWDFSARYSQRLPWGINGGIGGSYQISRNDLSSCSANLLLTKAFGRNWFADVSLDRTETFGSKPEYRAFLSLTYFFSDHRHSIRASHDTASGATRGDWQFRGQNSVEGFDGNLGFQQRRDDYSGFGALRYTGYRGEASIAHDITTPQSRDANVASRTSLRAGTALVYADGEMTLSRPIHDSFAIVAVKPEFKGQDIGVDAARDSHGAKADWVGPAVVPSLSSYLVRDISISAPDLPPGYDLGPSSHTIRPGYRSGTVIHVGESVSAFVSGFLLSSDGAPVPLQAGEVVSRDRTNASPIGIFTNRRGKFTAEGLQAGRYELRLFDDESARVPFEIPKGTVGMYEVGTLRLPTGVVLRTLSK